MLQTMKTTAQIVFIVLVVCLFDLRHGWFGIMKAANIHNFSELVDAVTAVSLLATAGSIGFLAVVIFPIMIFIAVWRVAFGR